MCATTTIIITAGATIFAALIGNAFGAFFAYKNGLKLVQKTNENNIQLTKETEFNIAAAQFRVAFVQILHDLEVGKKKAKIEIFDPYFIELKRAVFLFRPYIDKSKLVSYDSAWEEYAGRNGQSDYGYIGSIDREETAKILMKERIQKLLLFAENK